MIPDIQGNFFFNPDYLINVPLYLSTSGCLGSVPSSLPVLGLRPRRATDGCTQVKVGESWNQETKKARFIDGIFYNPEDEQF